MAFLIVAIEMLSTKSCYSLIEMPVIKTEDLADPSFIKYFLHDVIIGSVTSM